MTDFTVAKDHLVYVLMRDSYGQPAVYFGVFSSFEKAEAHATKLKKKEEAEYGYSYDYVVQPTRLDSGE